VHYNQKLGGPTRPFWGGGCTMAFGGDRRPWVVHMVGQIVFCEKMVVHNCRKPC